MIDRQSRGTFWVNGTNMAISENILIECQGSSSDAILALKSSEKLEPAEIYGIYFCSAFAIQGFKSAQQRIQFERNKFYFTLIHLWFCLGNLSENNVMIIYHKHDFMLFARINTFLVNHERADRTVLNNVLW